MGQWSQVSRSALHRGSSAFPLLAELSPRRLQFSFALSHLGPVRGDRMVGLTRCGLSRSRKLERAGEFLLAVLSLLFLGIPPVLAQQRREREPNSAYAER